MKTIKEGDAVVIDLAVWALVEWVDSENGLIGATDKEGGEWMVSESRVDKIG
jgi:hypothetical protein